MAVRAFTEPAGQGIPLHRSRVQCFWPSYSLYPVLSEIHGATSHRVPLRSDFELPTLPELRKGKTWDFRAALTFITTPNAPTGRGYATARLEELCAAQRGVVVLDEAYVDFAEEHAMALALKHPHVLVARTFSKAYSLCFQRVGYFVGHPALIGALQTIRDSYNVNGLGQAAAVATLASLPYYHKNFRRIKASRDRLRRELIGLGWEVLPSQTNFLLARPSYGTAKEWLDSLREKKILVRWFNAPEMDAWLRITVGSDPGVDALLRAVRNIKLSDS
jgi:histidinol-phosphate aminotransferase